MLKGKGNGGWGWLRFFSEMDQIIASRKAKRKKRGTGHQAKRDEEEGSRKPNFYY
jgi:hypothetical protein